MSKVVDFKVYKISFADGYEYIGQTKQNLGVRILGHKNNCSNTELHHRLNGGWDYKLRVLAEFATKPEALQFEVGEVLKLPLPINKMTDRYVLKKAGKARCSICERCRAETEFWGDRSRHNGLCSKCKECHTLLKKFMAVLRWQFKTPKLYQVAKREVRLSLGNGGVVAGKDPW